MNVLIHPASGILEFNSLSAGSSAFDSLNSCVRLSFLNSGELNLKSTRSGTPNRFSIDGNNGRLFVVTDSLSGVIFSVNDIAGIPVIEAYDNDVVIMGEYGSNTLVASGKNVGIGTKNPSEKLDVLGNAKFWQVRLSGQNGDPRSYSNGDVWYNSKDSVLRTDLYTNLNSLALGKTFATFKATDAYGFATASATTGVRNGIRMLEFDQTVEENTTFIGIVPSGICLNSGIIAKLFWTSTATSANVLWSISFEKMNTDLDTDSFSTATSGVSATNGTAGIITTSTLNCVNIDSVTQGDPFRVKLTRSAADILDTMTADAQLMMLELQATL